MAVTTSLRSSTPDADDLLPESMRLRGFTAVHRARVALRRFSWVGLIVGAVAVTLGWSYSSSPLMACGGAALGVACLVEWLTQFRVPPVLFERTTRHTAADFEALASEVREPWRALLVMDTAILHLSEGDVDRACRYLLALRRSGWLAVFPEYRYRLLDTLGMIDALEGRLEDAEAHFRQARREAPPGTRPYLQGTDIVVHLRRGDVAAARLAFEEREREFAEHPRSEDNDVQGLDEMRAFFYACILQAEGAPPEVVDRALAHAPLDPLRGWSQVWPALRPLARRAEELVS
jgi:hypothetical protein